MASTTEWASVADIATVTGKTVEAADRNRAANVVELLTGAIEQVERSDMSDRDRYWLKLAVAYDTLMRKGCALALLKRIGDMKRHPRFQQAARATASDVAGNATWFRGYRSDAIAAVGE